jgi:hypothetical protein
MGGHEISIKSIFDFRTSLPINEILYIQYIIRQYRYGVFLYEIYLDEAKKQGHCGSASQCSCFLASSK